MEENEIAENTTETETNDNTESSNESTETNDNTESSNDTENNNETDETGEATTGDTGNTGGSSGNIYVTCKCPEFKYHFFDKFLEQTYTVEVVNEEPNIMTKPLVDYTPTEGLLLIIVIILLIRLIFDYGRRLF